MVFLFFTVTNQSGNRNDKKKNLNHHNPKKQFMPVILFHSPFFSHICVNLGRGFLWRAFQNEHLCMTARLSDLLSPLPRTINIIKQDLPNPRMGSMVTTVHWKCTEDLISGLSITTHNSESFYMVQKRKM